MISYYGCCVMNIQRFGTPASASCLLSYQPTSIRPRLAEAIGTSPNVAFSQEDTPKFHKATRPSPFIVCSCSWVHRRSIISHAMAPQIENERNQTNTAYINSPRMAVDRKDFTSRDIVKDVWVNSLQLPLDTLPDLEVAGHDGPALPSSYKIGLLAQGSIATSAVAASLLYSRRNRIDPPPRVSVPLEHAVVEFMSERLYALNGEPAPLAWGAIGGLHKTSDGYVRFHDSFPGHLRYVLDMLNLPHDATRDQVASRISDWACIEFEDVATAKGDAAGYALRSYSQWDALPQSTAIDERPVLLRQMQQETTPSPPKHLTSASNKRCLSGIRVVEMSRVLAAPVAGRTLAAHGADVLWVTSPNLPNLPITDKDVARGKRTVQLDIHNEKDKEQLIELLRTCDVFIQGYRPGSLAAYGLSPEDLMRLNPNIICANLSAFGPSGPWSQRRGFDSLVQTCSGMNVSEAEHAGEGQAARPTPCQAIDHSAGYLLASGIIAALYHRENQGGAWRVDVSLAGAMKYLRSLGQYPGTSGFDCKGYKGLDDIPAEFFETRETGFGTMKAVTHGAAIQGCHVGWDVMPKPLGSDTPNWSS